MGKRCRNCAHSTWLKGMDAVPEICLKCEYVHGEPSNWKEKTITNADRIRAMSDEELKYIARAVIKSEDCPMGETECTDCVFHDLCLRGDYYYYNEEEWLQQSAEVDNG